MSAEPSMPGLSRPRSVRVAVVWKSTSALRKGPSPGRPDSNSLRSHRLRRRQRHYPCRAHEHRPTRIPGPTRVKHRSPGSPTRPPRIEGSVCEGSWEERLATCGGRTPATGVCGRGTRLEDSGIGRSGNHDASRPRLRHSGPMPLGYPTRTAAANTVVHSSFLSPTAVWVTF